MVLETADEGIVHLEVSHAAEARVVAVGVPLEAGLPVGLVRRPLQPRLADDVERGKLGHDIVHPARHVVLVGVDVGVHPDAVDAGVLDPPDGLLEEVLRQQLVLLIEVGHLADEPAIEQPITVAIGRVRVERRRADGVGLAVFLPAVEPVRRRRVGHPPVTVADMVVDHVHDDLHPARMAGVDQFDKLVVGPKARVDGVHVGRRVAVIGAVFGRHVVLEDGREPDRGEAEVIEVVEAGDHAAHVAALARVHVAAVDAF